MTGRPLDRSRAWWERAQAVIPLGTQTLSKSPTQFVQGVTPIFLERGLGSHVWDVDGNEFLDYPMALGPVLLGYADPGVNEAITRQLADGITYRNPNSGQSFTTLGVAGILEQLADRYINSDDGVLTKRGTSITDQIKLNNDRISTYDVRLEAKRAVLEAKFASMEQTIAKLQSQQSALASLG